MKQLATLILLLSSLTAAHAETRWVSDQLVITLRTGQGNQYQILKTLPSGTKLEVLNQADSGYTQVRTPAGDEGWVLTQYLTDKPTARLLLAQAQSQLAALQDENAKLKDDSTQLRQTNTELDKQVKDLSAQTAEQGKELARLKDVAERPLQLDNENKALKEQTIQLEKNLQIVTQENLSLKDRAEREWFMAGAGVLLAGMLLGLLLPKIRWRRRSSWDL